MFPQIYAIWIYLCNSQENLVFLDETTHKSSFILLSQLRMSQRV